jgi:hypothetical protein
MSRRSWSIFDTIAVILGRIEIFGKLIMLDKFKGRSSMCCKACNGAIDKLEVMIARRTELINQLTAQMIACDSLSGHCSTIRQEIAISSSKKEELRKDQGNVQRESSVEAISNGRATFFHSPSLYHDL